MTTPVFNDGSLHYVSLTTVDRRPLLAGEILHIAEHALESLPRRFPGLKVAGKRLNPDSLLLLLDFSRCDEDVTRVVQSYKTEVRKLASHAGFEGQHFWQREYEEGPIGDLKEWEALKTRRGAQADS